MALVVAREDPRAADVRDLIDVHLGFAFGPNSCWPGHALDAEALAEPTMTFFAARDDGILLGMGALRELDSTHGEVKSMHTAEASRGQGVGHAVLRRLIDEARGRRYVWLGLETGTSEAFAASRSLYRRLGFEQCEPFGDYLTKPHGLCMARDLLVD